jgi:hypothetical protein
MTFEQLLKKAEEEANEHELVTLDVGQIRSYLDGNIDATQELDNALDWAQGPVHDGEREVSYVLIKIVK